MKSQSELQADLQAAFIETAIGRAKREILADIQSGITPATVRSFSELHNTRDANTYGGLCEPEVIAQAEAIFPRDSEDNPENLFSQEFLDAANKIQDKVHLWLAQAGHLDKDGGDTDEGAKNVPLPPTP
ncbi:MAG: hypothetical protein EPN79_11295 [Burkholderiaceae bacterium]|nr:MAG: hypothetical protein EPN79_11295 [Burkholderiaceae bacterium]TBR76732.1 MAG: hypothetical protein EPN64_05780 [Burkholderiaceae bacterium]